MMLLRLASFRALDRSKQAIRSYLDFLTCNIDSISHDGKALDSHHVRCKVWTSGKPHARVKHNANTKTTHEKKMKTAELVQVCALDGHRDRAWHVSWRFDGKLLASCSGDKTIRIWAPPRDGSNSSDWECVAILEDAQGRTIRACEWFVACTCVFTSQ